MSLTAPLATIACRRTPAARLRVVLVTEGRPPGALDHEPGLEVMRARTLADALASATEQPVDAVLLDVPPTQHCRAEVLAATAALPGARFIAVGVTGVDESMAWAEAGVSGFVERRDSVQELTAVLASAMRGELVCSPELGTALLRRIQELSGERPDDQLARLTSREREILALIGEGLSNAAIAERTGLRLPTVKNHVRSLMGKLQVRTRSAAAAAGQPRGRPAP